MTDHEILKHIDDGAVFYLGFLGDAEHMESTDNGFYRVIQPKDNEQGLSSVFDIRLEHLSKENMSIKIAEVKSLNQHTWWPLCVSDALYRLIHLRAKEKASLIPPDGTELYMAVTSPEEIPAVRQPDGAVIKRAWDAEAFADCTRLGNDWSFNGYPYIHPNYHYPACESGKLRCYVCYYDGLPVSLCSVLDNLGICSLENVVTHTDYRRQGFAKYICAFAIKDAFDNGAELISLRADNPGTRELYTSLGFKIYNHAI